ncbi:phosphotransferase [Candidatus Pelagibacter sp.]|nr:phosphotransferase [Candidatus Pelagibacter sp.]
MNDLKNIKKITGDASFRKFFRKKNNTYSSIIVYAKKEKFKNLIVYDAINKILRKNKILAPKLYQENYNKNYIEIEDFGDDTIFKILRKNKNQKLIYFKKILSLLNKLQLIKDKNISNFNNKKYKIPLYSNKKLIDEANLFCHWYLKKRLSKNKKNIFIKKFNKIIKKLIMNLKLKNNIFVHRDFHVSNIMFINKKVAIIDSQDALIGNRAYDLASLIDDVRLKTSNSFKNKIFQLYLNSQAKVDKKKFTNDFEILSILRNLKIIGIFTRLAIRDNKKKYLRLIPYTWSLINLRINKNQLFKELKDLLKKNFKTQIK